MSTFLSDTEKTAILNEIDDEKSLISVFFHALQKEFTNEFLGKIS